MVLIWVLMTDNTEMSMRLNSSKQPQAPHWHRPENSLPTAYRKQKYAYDIGQYSDCGTNTPLVCGYTIKPPLYTRKHKARVIANTPTKNLQKV